MAQTLAELHAQHPYDKRERSWYMRSRDVSLDEAVAFGANLHLLDNPLEYLDSLNKDDFATANAIRRALLFLPPEVVIENYGTDVALWASVSSNIGGDEKEIYQELQDNHGYDVSSLEAARNWEWVHTYHNDVQHVIGQYALMQSLRLGVLDTVDLPNILQASARDGVELGASRVEDYALAPIEANYNSYYHGGRVKQWGGNFSETLRYNGWLDTPAGFTLTYKGVPNAMGGLAMYGNDELMLYQMQGVRGTRLDPTKSIYDKERAVGTVSSRGLAPIDWQKVMVEVTEDIARQNGIRRIGIQAAKNNVWIKERMSGDTEPHLPIDNAIRAYDVPAERLGFGKSAEDKRDNWHRDVSVEDI